MTRHPRYCQRHGVLAKDLEPKSTQDTQTCDTLFNQPNKRDACNAHMNHMVRLVDAFLTDPSTDPAIRAAAKNPLEAIKILPTAKFNVVKPSRAQHIIWQEEARENWLTEKRQRQIYQHFVFNGMVPFKYNAMTGEPEYIKFGTRADRQKEVFRDEDVAVPTHARKRSVDAKRAEATRAVAAMLTEQFCGLQFDEGGKDTGYGEDEYAQLEEMRSGVNPLTEDREVISVGDILPDADARVQYESF